MTSIAAACRAVLTAAEPIDKVKAARAATRAWRRGELAHDFDHAMPDVPARPAAPELLAPNRMPRRGKGGSERGRIALLHALAPIEFVAIDRRHVGASTRWIEWGCLGAGVAPAAHWRELIGCHFRGLLKPPFNDSARAAAGLTLEYYAGVAAG